MVVQDRPRLLRARFALLPAQLITHVISAQGRISCVGRGTETALSVTRRRPFPGYAQSRLGGHGSKYNAGFGRRELLRYNSELKLRVGTRVTTRRVITPALQLAELQPLALQLLRYNSSRYNSPRYNSSFQLAASRIALQLAALQLLRYNSPRNIQLASLQLELELRVTTRALQLRLQLTRS